LDNLKDAVDEFRELRFHSGSVQLALAVAKSSDPTGAALQYAAEGQPKDVLPLKFGTDKRIREQRCMRNECGVIRLSLKFLKIWKPMKGMSLTPQCNESGLKPTNLSIVPMTSYSTKPYTTGTSRVVNMSGYLRYTPVRLL
jgi:hypothetical protein